VKLKPSGAEISMRASLKYAVAIARRQSPGQGEIDLTIFLFLFRVSLTHQLDHFGISHILMEKKLLHLENTFNLNI
jgi:hypothetical protein